MSSPYYTIIKKWLKNLLPNMNKVRKTLEIPFIFCRVSMIFWVVLMFIECLKKKWIDLRLLTFYSYFFLYIIWQVEIIIQDLCGCGMIIFWFVTCHALCNFNILKTKVLWDKSIS